MKKNIIMALSFAIMSMSVPAYALDVVISKVTRNIYYVYGNNRYQTMGYTAAGKFVQVISDYKQCGDFATAAFTSGKAIGFYSVTELSNGVYQLNYSVGTGGGCNLQ